MSEDDKNTLVFICETCLEKVTMAKDEKIEDAKEKVKDKECLCSLKQWHLTTEKFYPEGDTTESFTCPTKGCEQVLSTDIMHSDDTRCTGCKNKLEFCSKCNGWGYVRTKYGESLRKDKDWPLINHDAELYKKIKSAYLVKFPIALSVLVAILITICTIRTPNVGLSIILMNGILGLFISFFIFRFFIFNYLFNKRVPNINKIKEKCDNCEGVGVN